MQHFDSKTLCHIFGLFDDVYFIAQAVEDFQVIYLAEEDF